MEDDNPLKAFLSIAKPKSKLMAECTIAAQVIRDVVVKANMHTVGKSLAYSYFIAILNTLEQMAGRPLGPHEDAKKTQRTHESFAILFSLIVHKVPLQFLAPYVPKVIAVLRLLRERHRNFSVVIDKYSIPILTKVFLCRYSLDITFVLARKTGARSP